MMTRRFSPLVAVLLGLLFASSSIAGQGRFHVDRNPAVHLSGRQVAPPTESGAQGEAKFQLSEDGNSLSYKVIGANLDNVMQAHIHGGTKGTNGPVIVNLYPATPPILSLGRVNGPFAEGTITAADFVGPAVGYPLSALLEAMEAGEVYVDIHTNRYPAGEIRGQMGSGDTVPEEPPCPAGPLFTVLPVSASNIRHVTPIGGFNPPSHTIPSDHPGISPTATGVPLVAPGNLHIYQIFRTTYLVSPFRQGTSDWGIDFSVCGTVRGRIAHMPSIADSMVPLLSGATCSRYNTADEEVESCDFSVDIHVSAGESLGTASTIVGGGFDFGLYDDSHETFYVNPLLVGGRVHAVCAFEYFEPTLKEYLLSRVSDGTRIRTDEPRCGTMEIDVAGTAQGLWVMESNPAPAGGDESSFLSLALDTITPSARQVLSVGPASLGARLMNVISEHTGRVNRAFSEVGPDGLIYCYGPDSRFGPFTYSFFVSLGSDGVLSIEKINHVTGSSPCLALAPPTWTFSTNRVRFIR